MKHGAAWQSVLVVCAMGCGVGPSHEAEQGGSLRGGLPVHADTFRAVGDLRGGPETCLASTISGRVVVVPGRCVGNTPASELRYHARLIDRSVDWEFVSGAKIYRSGTPNADPQLDTEIAVVILARHAGVDPLGSHRVWPARARSLYVVGEYNRILWGTTAIVASVQPHVVTLTGAPACTSAQGDDPGSDRGGPVFVGDVNRQTPGVAAIVQWGDCRDRVLALPLSAARRSIEAALQWVAQNPSGDEPLYYDGDGGEGEEEWNEDEPQGEPEQEWSEDDAPPASDGAVDCACDLSATCDVDDFGPEGKCACDASCCFCSSATPGCWVCDDSCPYALDGYCDEPAYCTLGTDATDCAGF